MTTPLAPARADPAISGSRWRYIPGFDGIRAIAVVGVLVYHSGVTLFPGGFLGVDVFFVLSGFLITSLLLEQLESRGTVSFRCFYAGRARRLLPPLAVLLLLCSVLVLTVARDAAAQFREHAVAAFFYVTNWAFIAQDQSYFEAMGRPALLQHLWSLAVEEQFYLLWPLMLYGLYRWSGRYAVGVAAFAGALASTVLMTSWAVFADMPASADASRLYFGTDTHCMGLLLGAAVATVWRPTRLSEHLGPAQRTGLNVIGWLGVAGILAAFVLVREDSVWLYRGGFLVVAVVSVAAVAMAAHPAISFGGILGREPLRYLGRRSYGLYLYHWPIFLVLRPGVDLPFDGIPVIVVRLGLTLVVAELSYRFVEMPIRRRGLERTWRAWTERGRLRAVALATATLGVAAAVVTVAAASVASVPAPRDVLAGRTAVGQDRTAKSAAQRAAELDGEQNPGPDPMIAPDYSDQYVTAIGDSVMLGAASGLSRRLPYVGIDAEVSRDWPGVAEAIATRRSWGTLGESVVIHTGTNGPADPDGIASILRSLRDRDVVVLVTVNTPHWWMTDSNRVLNDAAQRWPNVRLADWAAVSRGHPEYFVADGTHLTSAGIDAYARLIRQTLRGDAAVALD